MAVYKNGNMGSTNTVEAVMVKFGAIRCLNLEMQTMMIIQLMTLKLMLYITLEILIDAFVLLGELEKTKFHNCILTVQSMFHQVVLTSSNFRKQYCLTCYATIVGNLS